MAAHRATLLTGLLLKACGLAQPEELVGIVYRGGDRAMLAALAPIVLEAAEAGDSAANEIITAGATELASAAAAAARSLGLVRDHPGGTGRRATRVRSPLIARGSLPL